MLLIGFGDIHMSTEKFCKIPDIDTADFVIINGDLTNYGSSEDAKKVMDAALSVNPSVLAQVGNTPICNTGMLQRGGWVEVIIEKSHLYIALHERL